MFRRVFNYILIGTGAVSAVLIAFMAVVITYQVALRSFFGATVLWINDLVEYTLLWSTFLGAAFVLREERHIEMDFFVSKLGVRSRELSKILNSAIGAAICGVLAVFSLITVVDNYRRGILVIKTVEFPKYIVLIPIFIGTVLLTVQFMLRAVDHRKKLRGLDGRDEQIIYDL